MHDNRHMQGEVIVMVVHGVPCVVCVRKLRSMCLASRGRTRNEKQIRANRAIIPTNTSFVKVSFQ